jgi:hypothetical protein
MFQKPTPGNRQERFLLWLGKRPQKIAVVADGANFGCNAAYYSPDVFTRYSV